MAQPAQPPQPPNTTGHLLVGATAAPRSGIRQRTSFAGVRRQAASLSTQGMGQLELPFRALFASGSESSVGGTFVPDCVLSLHPLFAWKVPGSESSRVRKFQGAQVPHLELLLPGAKSPVPEEKDVTKYCFSAEVVTKTGTILYYYPTHKAGSDPNRPRRRRNMRCY